MKKWLYKDRGFNIILPPKLKKTLDFLEKELVNSFFFKRDFDYNYEIEIKYFDDPSKRTSDYWIHLKFHIEYNRHNRYNLMTFYFKNDSNKKELDLKLDLNYLDEDIIHIKTEEDLISNFKKFFKPCFSQMNYHLAKNIDTSKLLNSNFSNDYHLKEFEKKKRAYRRAYTILFPKHDSVLSKNSNPRRPWSESEKEIIIKNMSAYREEIYNELDHSNKQATKKITQNFAGKLMSKYEKIFEGRTIKNLANRLAYFDELLAGVENYYSKTDLRYFGKLKRKNEDLSKNPARIY